ncbi:MAG: M14 family metallopeptidase [Clostridium sp.]|nr:M14 family metallopeptidase [Clostridium sp.]
MIDTVVSVEMLVEEVMQIKKNRLAPDECTGNEKRLCIASGSHGDELGGQYICYQVIRRIKQDFQSLTGIVDVYPAMNPLGLDAQMRDFPLMDIDMNTVFPGDKEGAILEHAASKIIKDMAGADVCLDVHSSNSLIREIPQVRINDDVSESIMPYAKLLNTELVWIHPSTSVRAGSLSYALNAIGVKTMVIEAGVALRIDYDYCEQIVDGIFSLMKHMGIWQGEVTEVRRPTIATDGDVWFVNAESSGLFVPNIKHSMKVKKGEKIGTIVDVITGSVEERIYAPCDGLVFTFREYPAVEEGALIARIYGGDLT